MHAQAIVYRFGPYELRTGTRRLYKNGIKLKLRPQTRRVLEVLLERQGDVATREELRQLLWSADTFVDFEQGLNSAVKELRAALSDSADAPRYIETVPKTGYRMIAPVERASASPLATDQPSELPTSSDIASAQLSPTRGSALPGIRGPKRRWLSPVTAAIAATILLVVAGLWVWSRKHVVAGQTGGRLMLAVLPFENLTGDAGQEYFSDGLTEEMISQLGRVDPQRMGVIARTSVMRYKANPKPLDQVGHELGVEYVLEGSVRRDADTVRVSAQLIQVKDQTHLWSRQYDRELNSVLALQGEIAQEIADEIQLTMGDKHSSNAAVQAAAAHPASYEAYDLYLKGRYYWNKRTAAGFHQAADYFQQAIDKDPKYAQAYAGLADDLALLSTWEYAPAKDLMPKARMAALKALEINESLAEAHASLALIAEQYDYDWQTAEKEFRRAIQLDPDYATAHQWYAECLSFEGRFDEALAESERARQLDPLSLIIATDHAVILYYSRQYDRAIEQFVAVRKMEPDFPRSEIIFHAYIEKGRFAEALAVNDELSRTNQEGPEGRFAAEAYAYGRWGREAEAQRAFAKFEEECKLHPPSDADPPWNKLDAYLGIGRKDDAIAVLQKASVEQRSALTGLKVNPLYDPLRSNPRFQELQRLAHLAP